MTLHSTMFLLIPIPTGGTVEAISPLHSTMFLLIPEAYEHEYLGVPNFTFHNVSINTTNALSALKTTV